nr:DUF4422 domain-containing protein [Secundilactobacillus angelensis]
MVATHKLAQMPQDKSLYLPILVGAVSNWKKGIDYQRDDEGVNISDKNANFNELTAIYWAKYNLPETDIIGLVHYRRLFFETRRAIFSNLLKRESIEKYLEEYDVLVPQKRRYYIETNYSHYVHAHHKKPLLETRKVISQKFPDYLNAFDTVMTRRSAHMFNMFVMKREFFDDYTDWLFDVLKVLESKIDITSYDVQEARVFGYVSELLMDVWLLKNNVKFKELKWNFIGKKHTLKKIFFLIFRKFSSKKVRTHF